MFDSAKREEARLLILYRVSTLTRLSPTALLFKLVSFPEKPPLRRPPTFSSSMLFLYLSVSLWKATSSLLSFLVDRRFLQCTSFHFPSSFHFLCSTPVHAPITSQYCMRLCATLGVVLPWSVSIIPVVAYDHGVHLSSQTQLTPLAHPPPLFLQIFDRSWSLTSLQ